MPKSEKVLDSSRVKRACDQCRSKKIKCDGLAPVCGSCQCIGCTCTYAAVFRKRGPPKGYVEAIETRLNRVHEMLLEFFGDDPRLESVLAELTAPIETSSGDFITLRFQSPNDNKSKVDPSRSFEVAENQLNLFSGDLTIYEEIEDFRFHGNASGVYLMRNSALHNSGYLNLGANQTLHRRSNWQQLDVNPYDVPPSDLSDHLIHLYFDNFHPLFPVIDRPEFLRSLRTTQPPLLLLNAIYGIAARISDDPRIKSFTYSKCPELVGGIFFERAKLLLDCEYDTPNLSTVQAALLLAYYQPGAPRPSRSWIFGGIAIRIALELGLNRYFFSMPRRDRKLRKRVYWCCFVLDRLLAVRHGRPISLDERECNVPSFQAEDEEEPWPVANANHCQVISNFGYLVQLYQILGRILNNIYSISSERSVVLSRSPNILVNSLHHALLSWFHKLPLHLRLPISKQTPHLSAVSSNMHIIYHTCVILLHRPFLPLSCQEPTPDLLASTKACSESADTIIDLVYSRYNCGGVMHIVEPNLYSIFNATTFHLCYNTGIDLRGIKLNTLKGLKVLQALEPVWFMSKMLGAMIRNIAFIRKIGLEDNDLDSFETPKPRSPKGFYNNGMTTEAEGSGSRNEINPSIVDPELLNFFGANPDTMQPINPSDFSLLPASSIPHPDSFLLDSLWLLQKQHQMDAQTVSNPITTTNDINTESPTPSWDDNSKASLSQTSQALPSLLLQMLSSQTSFESTEPLNFGTRMPMDEDEWGIFMMRQ
ncbi:uncharacterized protein VTP21DRAFT_2916 [Calcarisporiella thermophila]|uniref:uncharacterized protein n=1 Tax=Calcarisporiella thermophila TaxID=911321 RepID=UPI003744AE86